MADPADPLSSDADSQTTGLLLNLSIGVPATVLCFLLFDPLRRRYPTIFEARRQLNLTKANLDHHGNRVATPPPPSYRFFGWLWPTLKLDLETMVHTHGLDATLFLRYCRFMTALFAYLCVPAAGLVPLYWTGGKKDLPENDAERTIGINRFSLSNVATEDEWRFWLVLAVEYLITAFVCVLLFYHFTLYCRDRRRYRAANEPANYAILVQDIPADACSEEAVMAYWERLFPGEIAKVFFVLDARRLEKVKGWFWKAVEKREVAEWKVWNEGRKRERKLEKRRRKGKDVPRAVADVDDIDNVEGVSKWSCGAPRNAAKAVVYWEERQTRYYASVTAQQAKRFEAGFPTTTSAIVVFTSRRTASIAAQTNFARKENEWRVSRAPEPEAICWGTLAVTGWTIYIRQAVTTLLCVALILFWIIPVTAIMGLVNLQELTQIEINGQRPFEFLEGIQDWSPTAVALVESNLPSAILIVFLTFVPNILELFVSISRIPSLPAKDRMVRDWYFLFVTFSNFLFVAFAGTLLNELAAIIDRPALAVDILARNIPKQAAFMMNFILLTALTETPRELLQIFRVLGRVIKLWFVAKTKRQKEDAETGDTSMDFVAFYSMSQLVALLGLVYSTIQPFIIPCCMAYFAIMYLVFKYNLCFTLHNEYEDGGRMYGGALYAVWGGLFSHLLTMVGVFGLNKSPAQSVLIIIPSVLSVLFLAYCFKSFNRVIEHGSALETQDRIEQLEGKDEIEDDLLDAYEHPGFEPLPDEVENLSGVPESEHGKSKVGIKRESGLTETIGSEGRDRSLATLGTSTSGGKDGTRGTDADAEDADEGDAGVDDGDGDDSRSDGDDDGDASTTMQEVTVDLGESDSAFSSLEQPDSGVWEDSRSEGATVEETNSPELRLEEGLEERPEDGEDS